MTKLDDLPTVSNPPLDANPAIDSSRGLAGKLDADDGGIGKAQGHAPTPGEGIVSQPVASASGNPPPQSVVEATTSAESVVEVPISANPIDSKPKSVVPEHIPPKEPSGIDPDRPSPPDEEFRNIDPDNKPLTDPDKPVNVFEEGGDAPTRVGNAWDDFHLPAADKGTWSGVRGNSDWTPHNPADYGLKQGESVKFVEGYIDLNPHTWNNQRFKVSGLTGVHDTDMPLVWKKIAREKGWIHRKGRHAGKEQIKRVQEWLSKNKVTPHHDPITGDVILVKSGQGNPHHIPHTGDAYRLRNR